MKNPWFTTTCWFTLSTVTGWNCDWNVSFCHLRPSWYPRDEPRRGQRCVQLGCETHSTASVPWLSLSLIRLDFPYEEFPIRIYFRDPMNFNVFYFAFSRNDQVGENHERIPAWWFGGSHSLPRRWIPKSFGHGAWLGSQSTLAWLAGAVHQVRRVLCTLRQVLQVACWCDLIGLIHIFFHMSLHVIFCCVFIVRLAVVLLLCVSHCWDPFLGWRWTDCWEFPRQQQRDRLASCLISNSDNFPVSKRVWMVIC